MAHALDTRVFGWTRASTALTDAAGALRIRIDVHGRVEARLEDRV
jgi:hypothetical protein